MKRIIAAMVVCLLLCGCASPAEDPTETAWQPGTAVPTEPAGSYEPGSAIEKATNGAVRAYAQNLGEILAIRAVGKELLVFSDRDTTTITCLTGDNLFRVAQIQLNLDIPWQTVHVSANWVVYYDSQEHALVYLDENLKEIRRRNLEAELQGYPFLTNDGQKLYYCTVSGVRCLDMEQGISRLVKEMTFPIQSVSGLLMGDQILAVDVSDGISHSETLYLDAQTGAMVGGLPEGITLTTGKEYFYAVDPEGVVNQMLFGTAGEIRLLTPANYLDSGGFLPESHGAWIVTQDGMLEYYDLHTGKRTASVIRGDLQPESVTMCEDGYLYFLCGDGNIYRWDPSATPLTDDQIYTGSRYTLAEPNEAEMEACRTYAQQLGQTYGLTIQIYTDAVDAKPFDYDLVPEYQTPLIMDGLRRLDSLLSHFPEGFFATAVSGMENGRVTVNLVRELIGSPESGIREGAQSAQFWEGNHAHVTLALGENLESNFYHDLFHVLETRVLSESIAYYRWDELNPKGFVYDNNYTAYQDRDSSPWLEGTDRAFIDAYSMSFPKEDRARVMEYACMAGNEHYFTSAVMQKKLRTLCQGIREAYGLQSYTEPLLWEQYLQ